MWCAARCLFRCSFKSAPTTTESAVCSDQESSPTEAFLRRTDLTINLKRKASNPGMVPNFPRCCDFNLAFVVSIGFRLLYLLQVFIEEFLNHHGILSLFGRGITTNGGVFKEDGRLDVQPHHSDTGAPHGCSLCPPNMCKGWSGKGSPTLLYSCPSNPRNKINKLRY